jgi:DNA-binding XRE family transcriptional regulator
MAAQTIVFDGKPYIILPREEYDRLTTLAKAADMPPLPQPDGDGNYPAVEYARASLARKIIRARAAAGLSQRELATRAGISFENLCRIETGKHTPNVATIDKIDRALRKAANAELSVAGRPVKVKRRNRKKPSK